MAGDWKVTLRLGPRVVRERAATLEEAIAELRISLVAAAGQASGEGSSGMFREYEASAIVIARLAGTQFSVTTTGTLVKTVQLPAGAGPGLYFLTIEGNGIKTSYPFENN